MGMQADYVRKIQGLLATAESLAEQGNDEAAGAYVAKAHALQQKYSIDQLNATAFDPKSIMLYAFPASLIVGGKATANNTDLSTGDKTFIGTNYPKKGAKPVQGMAAAGPQAVSPQRVHPGIPKFA